MSIGLAPHLFCFGLGYTAETLARRLLDEGWRISGTTRTEETLASLRVLGIEAHLFDRARPLADIDALLSDVTDLLSSVPPDAAGDPVLDMHGTAIEQAPALRWVGYLSTTGVYGDTAGALVDEHAPLAPTSQRSTRRVKAERAWLDRPWPEQVAVQVFRLAGIYGPGRSAFDHIRAGDAKRIDKPGHVSSRIHVDDVATILRASMARPERGGIYNVCDDDPAPPADVIAYACALLGVPPPPLISLEQAAKEMSAMAASFWVDNRRVDNTRIKRDLGVRLRYPDYRAGLAAILSATARVESAPNS
ncbi:NAD(P)-dependent oxidoreductase [uncultured Defluviicoccus sp.]|uniref:NAD(P)-dependent oxidoreductase n=1 Tax=metagenome TaxID=256318 RepID=A0A380TCP3_9ZZZZ|nr:NAD(P)-dependent oxidoreductase [uncultured Defluviicoccus sp.]